MPSSPSRSTWFLVADSHSAMLLASERRGELPRAIWSGVHVQRADHATAHSPLRGGSGEYDPYEDEMRDWARDLADFLGDGRRQRRYERLILAVDPAMLDELRACLDAPTAHRVAAAHASYLLSEAPADLPRRLLDLDGGA